jgi:hypothetical protein
MPHRIFSHVRSNVIAYLALFVALGGSSYAAVSLAPGSVDSRAIAKGAVTRSKLATNSVSSAQVANGALRAGDFRSGALLKGLRGDAGKVGGDGLAGLKGEPGAAGPTGPRGLAGADGNASIAAKARMSGSVSAPHGATTNVPLTSASWTQSAGTIQLLAGTVTMNIPASCSGSFGNTLNLAVDGTAQTFAVAPTAPASGSVTVPFVVGTLSERTGDAQHTLSARFANSCTGDGQDYTVTDVKVDALNFG